MPCGYVVTLCSDMYGDIIPDAGWHAALDANALGSRDDV